MDLWSVWWVWMSVAVVLAIVEVIVPGYIFLGFAAGAAFVGAILLLGLGGLTLPWALLIFAFFSLIAFVLLRKVFGIRHGQVKIWDRDIND
ncbi:MAG: hypothetical protein ACI86S_002427 [Paracoccaceae bacterium]|jgi:membrane protein implicated in regulation of membrane protease activity